MNRNKDIAFIQNKNYQNCVVAQGCVCIFVRQHVSVVNKF